MMFRTLFTIQRVSNGFLLEWAGTIHVFEEKRPNDPDAFKEVLEFMNKAYVAQLEAKHGIASLGTA